MLKAPLTAIAVTAARLNNPAPVWWATAVFAALFLIQCCLSLSAAQLCTTFKEGQRVEVQGRIVQSATTETEEGEPPYKFMELVLDKPLCDNTAPDGKITSIPVSLPVSNKWRGRHVRITGDMTAGDAWSINVKKIAPAR
jgi:hypothetical protein